MIDEWGIIDGYHDVDGVWHETSASSAQACRQAMGTPYTGQPMVFHRQGLPIHLDPGTVLELEDGTECDAASAHAGNVPLGYHRLVPREQPPRPFTIVPDIAHRTPGKRWGWAVQIAALRDRRGWGTGDMATLAQLGHWASTTGASLIAMNPLHAPLPLAPRDPSPYFPSSRLWRDPALLRVDAPPVRSPDRDAIWAAKRKVLLQEWASISDRDRDRFEKWRTERGESLEWFALHEALVETNGAPWPSWRDSLRTPSAATRAKQTENHADLVAFHAWLQWRLAGELAETSSSIGLVSDLAIGANPVGADAWRFQDLFAPGVRVGAPPDEFNQAGQDWGCAAFIPFALRAAHYQPFIEALRANLEYGAGLRIDHVMGMFRLYWIPPGGSSRDGVYVAMPSNDLLDLICLESVRAGADIVGEDLGTVDPEVHEAMRDRRILGTRLIWFTDREPSRFPENCQASISTHDLPTVAGLLSGADAIERRSVGVAVDDDADANLLSNLRRAAAEGGITGTEPPDVAADALRALAEGPPAIVLATFDDALGVTQRPNIPGTTTERPNWSLPLPVPVEDLPTQPGVVATISSMSARSGT